MAIGILIKERGQLGNKGTKKEEEEEGKENEQRSDLIGSWVL